MGDSYSYENRRYLDRAFAHATADKHKPQAKVLLAELTECTSARGSRCLRSWAGASNLIAFPGTPDDQGRATWRLFLVERQPKPGLPT